MSNIRDEKTQYNLIQEYLLNSSYEVPTEGIIKSIIEFLFEKFGTEFWKYIEKDNLDLFKKLEGWKKAEKKSIELFKNAQREKKKNKQKKKEELREAIRKAELEEGAELRLLRRELDKYEKED